MTRDDATTLPDRLRALLREAMRAGDRPLVGPIRTVLGEFANAEAVDASQHRASGGEFVAGSVAGVAAAEAPRREVAPAEQLEILVREIAELRASAVVRQDAGLAADAANLRRSADVLEQLVIPTTD